MTDKNILTEYTGVYTGIFLNMPLKEIKLEASVKEFKKIIDGVDVSGCIYYNPLGNYSCGGCRRCEEKPDCYYKQLVRKTQECDRLKHNNGYEVGALEKTIDNLIVENKKLKNKIKKLRKNLALEIEANDHFRKALDEIEEYCNEQNLKYDLTACEILSIIEEVKGE